MPLIPKGASLSEAGSGQYDDHYRNAAQTLALNRPNDAVLYVRTGWEFNGDWFPWTAHGKAKEFVEAYRRFVTAFRGVSTRFRFEWNVNIGDVGMNPESAYPGDAFVDIIGMDFYWNTAWDPKDPVEAYKYMIDRRWGLQWHQEFAAAHHKPTAYSEWGVMSNNGAAYIDKIKGWFAAHEVVYQTYWNSNVAFKGNSRAVNTRTRVPPTERRLGGREGFAERRPQGVNTKLSLVLRHTTYALFTRTLSLGTNQSAA